MGKSSELGDVPIFDTLLMIFSAINTICRGFSSHVWGHFHLHRLAALALSWCHLDMNQQRGSAACDTLQSFKITIYYILYI